jgi:hypothetical protein
MISRLKKDRKEKLLDLLDAVPRKRILINEGSRQTAKKVSMSQN